MAILSLKNVSTLSLGLIVATTLGCSQNSVGFNSLPKAVKNQTSNNTDAIDHRDPDDPLPPPVINPIPGVDPDDPTPQPQPEPQPVSVVENFNQAVAGGKVDILFVVDNSDSMYFDHAQERVKNMFRGFVATLNGVDYQIGVTTTDVSHTWYYNNKKGTGPREGWMGKLDFIAGTQGKILTPANPLAEQALLETLHREETLDCRFGKKRVTDLPCGSNNEQPLTAVKQAIERRLTDNSGFFRADAQLVTIMITDSDEVAGELSGLLNSKSLIKFINLEFNGSKKYTAYGVIVNPKDNDCAQEQRAQDPLNGARSALQVYNLAVLTGGFTMSICKDNFAEELKVIGQKVGKTELLTKVTLSAVPVTSSVKVSVTPVQNVTWTLQGKNIIFNKAPASGSKIKVEYVKLP